MVTPRSTTTWPSSGCSSPVIIRNRVVLPEPLGPTRPTFSPRWSAADASMKRSWWPFCLLMLSRRIIAGRGTGKLRRRYATSRARHHHDRVPNKGTLTYRLGYWGRKNKEATVPVILWLLGVPLSLIILLMLFGFFR